MNVLVLGWEYPPAVAGGLGAACHGLTTALARADGVERVTLAVPATAGPTPADESGVERVEIGVETAGGLGLPLLSPYSSVAPSTDSGSRSMSAQRLYGHGFEAALRSYTRGVFHQFAHSGRRFDVVHAHDWMTAPAALRLRMRFGIPLCLHVHSTAFDRAGTARAEGELCPPPNDMSARIEAAGVRSADRVVAVSAFTKTVIERGFRVPRSHVEVVHNAPPRIGVSPSVGTVEPRLVHGRARKGERTVLFVGRLTRQKGATYFVRAAAELSAQRSDVRFVVIGDGEERAQLVEEAARLGLGRRLFFAGSADDALRDGLYATSDVYVMTSLSEPFGLTPLEALGGGAAVVLPKDAGITEVVTSAPRVNPWDIEGLVRTIGGLLDDDSMRADLVTRGRAEVAQLTWEKSGQELSRVLLEACAA